MQFAGGKIWDLHCRSGKSYGAFKPDQPLLSRAMPLATGQKTTQPQGVLHRVCEVLQRSPQNLTYSMCGARRSKSNTIDNQSAKPCHLCPSLFSVPTFFVGTAAVLFHEAHWISAEEGRGGGFLGSQCLVKFSLNIQDLTSYTVSITSTQRDTEWDRFNKGLMLAPNSDSALLQTHPGIVWTHLSQPGCLSNSGRNNWVKALRLSSEKPA